jgi:hypothetical protein
MDEMQSMTLMRNNMAVYHPWSQPQVLLHLPSVTSALGPMLESHTGETITGRTGNDRATVYGEC